MTPSISIIHPSRSRPEMAGHTIANWMTKAHNPGDIEYILSLDNTDPEWQEYSSSYHTKIIVNNNTSAIEAINVAAKQAKGNLLIVVSDDFDCPMHWDKLLLHALEGKEDYVVRTNDLQQPWIITLPIMDRKYYERFGYIYHPAYIHMFADTHMTHVASMLVRDITLPITFPHRHYTTGNMTRDAINEKNDATWGQGEAVYLALLRRNFDLPAEQIVYPASYCHESHFKWLQSKGAFL